MVGPGPLHRSGEATSRRPLILLKELSESVRITPVIDRTTPLTEAPEAIRHVEQGHARGKVVITV